MSAILEEGIGFGGKDDQTTDTAWERVKDKYPQSPYTSSYVNGHELNKGGLVDLNPALKELKEKREQSMNEQVSEKKNTIQQKVSIESIPEKIAKQDFKQDEDNVTEQDIDELITELEEDAGVLSVDPSRESEPRKNLEETKKMIQNFHEKVAKYPKHLSYEGSMVLCVLLSMKSTAYPSLNNLPMVDQTLIRALVPKKFISDLDSFAVTFDQNKDFDLKFTARSDNEKYLLTMFNSVAHPRPEDLKDLSTGVVPVEKNGDKIAVGGKILLDRKGIKRLIGVEPLKRDAKAVEQDDEPVRRQPVAGRNAYEIRADVLQMAIDWSIKDPNSSPDDVVDLAKKFYSFIEKR